MLSPPAVNFRNTTAPPGEKSPGPAMMQNKITGPLVQKQEKRVIKGTKI